MSLALTPGEPWPLTASKIVSFNVPSRVTVNRPVDAEVTAKIVAPVCVTNFIIGVAYESGPTPSIQFFDGSKWAPLVKGAIAFIQIDSADSGKAYKGVIRIKFPQKGSYVVRGVCGYIAQELHIDDYVDREVTVVPSTPFTMAAVGGEAVYPILGAVVGAVGGYIATKEVKGVVAGAVAGGGLAYAATRIKNVIPRK